MVIARGFKSKRHSVRGGVFLCAKQKSIRKDSRPQPTEPIEGRGGFSFFPKK
jgi:hypothetical protein